MGFEGANVLFDTWVQPLMMGLEEHLLTMFRGDFEFHENAAASHLGRTAPSVPFPMNPDPLVGVALTDAAALATRPAEVSTAPAAAPILNTTPMTASESARDTTAAAWAADAERELKKIPFFVRGKARRNTERFALEHGVALITVETLYDAKSHYSR
jgi:light-independent protochlorophyllide reductase subunit B